MSESRLIVPAVDDQPWPTLGGEVCDWIEANLVHGPGDVLGERIQLTDEYRFFIWRAYEVYPRGHELAGRRRFKRVALYRRKGTAKTELAALIGLAEGDPTAPVRCDGFRKVAGDWVPVGRPVKDPYIPMVAVTEEQTEDLAYGAAREILLRCDLGNEYDIGLGRITPRSAPGKLQALASAPSARDGARTTFQHFDETHLFVAERLKRAHATMLRNIPKRKDADAWSLETTTMYEPGEESVAEGTHHYAIDVAAGRIEDPKLYFDHRQASTAWDISKPRELMKAIKEASGDAWPFTDADAIASQFSDPQADKSALRRFWLNQRVKGSRRWLAPEVIEGLEKKRAVTRGARVVLAFDGSYSRDSTALVGCTVEAKPHVWVEACWERPLSGGQSWRVRRTDVDAALEEAMERYDVAELAPDPPGWHREIEEWEDTYGEAVVRFETIQTSRMGPACDDFEQGARDGDFTIDPSEELRRHLGNCMPVNRRGYTVVTKSSSDSPDKIDLAVGAIIAYHRARWHFLNPDDDDVVAFVLDPRMAPA